MKKLSLLVLVTFILAVGGGVAFLATWDIPAPVTNVERVIPDDRFPR